MAPLPATSAARVVSPRLSQERVGSIRGVVYDKEFNAPLALAVVKLDTGQSVTTSDQGTYVFSQVPAGKYALDFSKAGYVRQIRNDVIVVAGQLTEVNVELAGDITEMDEFIVEDLLQAGTGTEAALLQLRLESPALMDSVSSDLMSRAGTSDAASALRLVSGASLQDGKSAVIRGMPDRYVSSQLNNVRLPTADEDKRAVELDQFPAVVIESIQVTKTFTPDQQGDASGGAVNMRLKGIPDEHQLRLSAQLGYNSQVFGEDDFLSYEGGGIDFWGRDADNRGIQNENIGTGWDGAMGVSTEDAPIDYKWSVGYGGQWLLDNGLQVGGSFDFFYERDSSFIDDGVDDSYWVTKPGDPLTPKTIQGTPQQGDFKTQLFDVTQGVEAVQWGGLGVLGVESENHALSLTYLYSHTAEDKATLATDTRGKEHFFPGYDPHDPKGPGNTPGTLNAAPYLRLETLEYTERTTGSLQLNGSHRLPFEGFELGDVLFRAPELGWTLAESFADLDQPDKRQFGALWLPASFNPGVPPFLPPFTTEPTWYPYKPDANINLGNAQHIFKEIEEDSLLGAADLKFPFEQWSGDEGYLKLGVFGDRVDRTFDQDTFRNTGEGSFEGGWEDPWSHEFPSQNVPIIESLTDVDYDGDQDISAWYTMLDLPLASSFSLIGGVRFETTEISIVNDPEADATWFPPGEPAPVQLNPGDADVSFDQDDVLPSIGFVYEPLEQLTLRGGYSETVARQTFKELTPILQQEYLGGEIFIGNPALEMSGLENYDLRVDYTPYPGSLFSVSWFDKDVEDPIEYVQRVDPFSYTTAVNYPEGELSGIELELRQNLGDLWDEAQGLSVGINATFIDSEVTLPDDEVAMFAEPGIEVDITSRDMTNAPEHLYNLYLTYDLLSTGTQFGLFYTVQGDTLVAGAGQAKGNFVPDVYATEFDTLNASVSQRLGEHFRLQIQGKNLTNPDIETVYRSDSSGDDKLKTSYSAGFELSVTLSAKFSF
jgi:outer membrane receptor protein involved in Fe transport